MAFAAPRSRLFALILGAALACIGGDSAIAESGDAAVSRYDASRDAAADIDRALAQAHATGRRVLLIIGGDWCKDCRELDALLAGNPAIDALRRQRFVTVKVFVGSENRNERVLARYPKLNWVPTLIELDAAGRARRSAASTQFHEGERLVPARVRAFLVG